MPYFRDSAEFREIAGKSYTEVWEFAGYCCSECHRHRRTPEEAELCHAGHIKFDAIRIGDRINGLLVVEKDKDKLLVEYCDGTRGWRKWESENGGFILPLPDHNADWGSGH